MVTKLRFSLPSLANWVLPSLAYTVVDSGSGISLGMTTLVE